MSARLAGATALPMLLLLATESVASTPTPLGPPFVVASDIFFANANQADMNDSGEFIVYWHGPPYMARKYDASGTPIAEFELPNAFASPVLDDQGGFTQVFPGASGADPDGVLGQRFDGSGNPIGAPFQVNDHTPGSQTGASVEHASTGDFVVAWTSESSPGNDNTQNSVQARRFGATGGPIGAQFQVNTLTTVQENGVQVGVASSGEFVVSWTSSYFNPTFPYNLIQELRSRRFDASGSALGVEHSEPGAIRDLSRDGNFVVAWTDAPIVPFYYVRHHVRTPDGSLVGQGTSGLGIATAVGALDGRSFIVAWDSTVLPLGHFARQVEADGIPVGAQFAIPDIGTIAPPFPSDGERFLVTWAEGEELGEFTLYAQRFTTVQNVPSASPWALLTLVMVALWRGTKALRPRQSSLRARFRRSRQAARRSAIAASSPDSVGS